MAWPFRALILLSIAAVLIVTQHSSHLVKDNRYGTTTGTVIEYVREPIGDAGYPLPLITRYRTKAKIRYEVNGHVLEFETTSDGQSIIVTLGQSIEVFYTRKNPQQAFLYSSQANQHISIILSLGLALLVYEFIRARVKRDSGLGQG